MNAVAQDSLEMGPRQRAALFAATGFALVTLVPAIVLQTAYHGVILLWVWLGLPVLFVAKAAAHIGRVGIARPAHRLGEAPRQEVALTFDELALIYKSLEAVRTLGALPPQDELLEDTIQVVDQGLNTFAR